jgi:hypothetical protein
MPHPSEGMHQAFYHNQPSTQATPNIIKAAKQPTFINNLDIQLQQQTYPSLRQGPTKMAEVSCATTHPREHIHHKSSTRSKNRQSPSQHRLKSNKSTGSAQDYQNYSAPSTSFANKKSSGINPTSSNILIPHFSHKHI